LLEVWHQCSGHAKNGEYFLAFKAVKIQEYAQHCNRHTFASKLIMSEVVLHMTAELLGYKTLRWICCALISLRRPNIMSAVEMLVYFGRAGNAATNIEVFGVEMSKTPKSKSL
jgi:hypothetical protein